MSANCFNTCFVQYFQSIWSIQVNLKVFSRLLSGGIKKYTHGLRRIYDFNWYDTVEEPIKTLMVSYWMLSFLQLTRAKYSGSPDHPQLSNEEDPWHPH